jgi:hypothetical protein
MQLLAEFEMRIQHVKETKNERVDALSRRSNYDIHQATTSAQMLEETEEELIVTKKVNEIFTRKKILDQQIMKIYEKNIMTNEYRNNVHQEVDASANSYIRIFEKIYVSSSQKQRIIKEAHEELIHDHQNYRKTV